MNVSQVMDEKTQDKRPLLCLCEVFILVQVGVHIGLLVVLAIVDEPIDLKCHSQREGVLGSAVIRDRVTDIVDIQAVMERHSPRANAA